MGKKKTIGVDCLFNSEGQVKKKIKYHPDFLRPIYQYTTSEVKNHQRMEIYHDEGAGEYYDDSYLFSDDTGIN